MLSAWAYKSTLHCGWQQRTTDRSGTGEKEQKWEKFSCQRNAGAEITTETAATTATTSAAVEDTAEVQQSSSWMERMDEDATQGDKPLETANSGEQRAGGAEAEGRHRQSSSSTQSELCR